jgi:hypothetical protein
MLVSFVAGTARPAPASMKAHSGESHERARTKLGARAAAAMHRQLLSYNFDPLVFPAPLDTYCVGIGSRIFVPSGFSCGIDKCHKVGWR